MGDDSGSWKQVDSWQRQGADPWSSKGRLVKFVRQCFYHDQIPFGGHGNEREEWLFGTSPGTAITDEN